MAQEKVWKAPVGSASRKVILVVEDDAATAARLVDIIPQEMSSHVFVATDPFAALHFVKQIKPDLFIVEYFLPGMSGIALYDHLHANRELAALPALILTANWQHCLKEIETRQLIAIEKPFNGDDFLLIIDEMLSWSSNASFFWRRSIGKAARAESRKNADT